LQPKRGYAGTSQKRQFRKFQTGPSPIYHQAQAKLLSQALAESLKQVHVRFTADSAKVWSSLEWMATIVVRAFGFQASTPGEFWLARSLFFVSALFIAATVFAVQWMTDHPFSPGRILATGFVGFLIFAGLAACLDCVNGKEKEAATRKEPGIVNLTVPTERGSESTSTRKNGVQTDSGNSGRVTPAEPRNRTEVDNGEKKVTLQPPNADKQKPLINQFERLKEKAKANNFNAQLMSMMMIATVLAGLLRNHSRPRAHDRIRRLVSRSRQDNHLLRAYHGSYVQRRFLSVLPQAQHRSASDQDRHWASRTGSRQSQTVMVRRIGPHPGLPCRAACPLGL
jgi:hypothetical protein